MKYRRRMGRRESRRNFTRNAGYHKKNGAQCVMRGGIRL